MFFTHMFLIFHETICCRYLLEISPSPSHEKRQHMFQWRYKKTIIFTPHLICNCDLTISFVGFNFY